MQSLSVVIICKNEAGVIAETLNSLSGLTDDIVVYDNGSTDDTIEIVKPFNVQLHTGAWEGFGQTKRKAIMLAKYDWVLNLDADEMIDHELKQSLLQMPLNERREVFEIKFKNFLGTKWLKHGEWGGDKHIRLFNRTLVNWDDAPVHEKLVLPGGTVIKKLAGYVLHRTARNIKEYRLKMENYARLNAEKYHLQGKKASWLRIHMSPGFTFFNYYILHAGFLDGYSGYVCAKMTAYYTFLKYSRLKELTGKSVLRTPLENR